MTDAPTSDSLLHDWNGAGPHRFRAPARAVLLQDETLREGMQSPTVAQPPRELQERLLLLMERLGIDSASLGIPVAGAAQVAAAERLCRLLVERGCRLRPNLGGRTLVDDVRPIAAIARRTGCAIEACLFIGSSPIRRYVEGWSIEQIERRTRDSIAFATDEGLRVTFITEDTTRSAPGDLRRLFAAAVEAGASRICLCDTVGSSTPEGARNLVAWTRSLLDELRPEVEIDWHGHQDRGLGLANALAAIEAGASRIHATALGLGERVGNTSMEQLLVNLQLMGLRRTELSALEEYAATAARATGFAPPPNAPVVGRDAFRTATGVHAAALVKARRAGDDELADRVYSAIPARWLGREQEIVVGPLSGAANARECLRALELPDGEDPVRRVLDAAKRAGRVLSATEIVDSVRDDEPAGTS